jgi:hypothetical protein
MNDDLDRLADDGNPHVDLDDAPTWQCPCCGKSTCDGYCTVDGWGWWL